MDLPVQDSAIFLHNKNLAFLIFRNIQCYLTLFREKAQKLYIYIYITHILQYIYIYITHDNYKIVMTLDAYMYEKNRFLKLRFTDGEFEWSYKFIHLICCQAQYIGLFKIFLVLCPGPMIRVSPRSYINYSTYCDETKL